MAYNYNKSHKKEISNYKSSDFLEASESSTIYSDCSTICTSDLDFEILIKKPEFLEIQFLFSQNPLIFENNSNILNYCIDLKYIKITELILASSAFILNSNSKYIFPTKFINAFNSFPENYLIHFNCKFINTPINALTELYKSHDLNINKSQYYLVISTIYASKKELKKLIKNKNKIFLKYNKQNYQISCLEKQEFDQYLINMTSSVDI